MMDSTAPHPAALTHRTLAERYLSSTQWRLAAGYTLLVALLLVTIVAATYIAVFTHQTTQIHGQLVAKTSEKLAVPNIAQILRQRPEIKDEEESVRTFIVSRDGVLRDADAVVQSPPDQAAVTRVLHSGKALFSTIRGPTNPLSVYTAPILRHRTVAGVIQAVTTTGPYNVVLQYLLFVSLATGSIGLLLAVALGLLMARWGLRPVRGAITSQQVFAQNAAHELRAPLTVVRTAAELALRAGDSSEMAEALTAIVRQTEHLDAVVGDLRLLAQGDAGHLLVDKAPVDLAALARDVSAEIQPTARERRVQVKVVTPAVLMTDGDQFRLRQLLLILIDNALQHAAGGTISISLAQVNRKAIMTVQDTGAGIAPHHLPHIFDRFYRAETNRAGDHGGAGLGLAIAREIVEAHGGRITVESRVGMGTAFRVILPAAGSAAQAASREAKTGPSSSS
jgi:signal transduction histidine kinase